MEDTIEEAKKMTSRKVSTMEESKTSKSTLDSAVTITKMGYTFHKGGQKPGQFLFGFPSSRSPGKSGFEPMLNECDRVQHAVLQSPDHNTVHVIYGHTNEHFVLSELTEELKTRTGLKLMSQESREVTSLFTADSVLIVIVDCQEYVTNKLLRQTLETSGHPDTHTLFIQKGHNCPDWVKEKLSRCSLMLYCGSKMYNLLNDHRLASLSAGASTGRKDVRTLFWDNVSTIIGDPHMDPTRRAMLSALGLVQHAVCQSPDHNTVHVIYGHTNEHFVLSELTEELKTRTGLQLVPPQSRVATSSSTADSVLIVIVDRHDRVTDRLLRQAVETSRHPDTHTLFIQKGHNCPGWVKEENVRCSLMCYCGSEMDNLPNDHRLASRSADAPMGREDIRTLFWDNVSTMMGDPHMDPTRRAMLNEFGLVQHAVLQSPDHNTVHVIYGHTNKHFVHSELTEELKTRTGLQLVPPQSHVATSSSTADSVLIVIVDRHDSVTDRLLRQAVETSRHPDTHTLFIQMGSDCPGWVKEENVCCSLMCYCGSEMHNLPNDHRLASLSVGASTGREDIRTFFWDNVSTMMDDPHMDPTHRAMLNDFGVVQHAVLQSPDHNTVHVIYGHTNRHFVHSELTEELKTRTGLQLVPPQSRVATSSSTADSVLIVIVDRHDRVTDRLLRQAVETSRHPDTHTLFIQKGDICPDWVKEKNNRCSLMYYCGSEMHNLPNDHRLASPSVGASTWRKNIRTLFWDNVSTMIGDPHMDPTHRAMLNEFGLVQHAVLHAPDHNTVHVIYDHTNTRFVHSELTEELKTRTGLQLVPPQSRVATSSSTTDSVLIVIVDRHDSVTDKLLRQAVETSGHPDTHILFIQTGYRRPDWVENHPLRCLMKYSKPPEMLHPSSVLHTPSSVSEGASTGLKDVRTLFWDNVSTMIGDPHMNPTHRAMLNEFDLVQHAVLQSPDHNTVHVIYDHTIRDFVHNELIEELKTRTGLQLVPPQSRVATSSFTADIVFIFIIHWHDSMTDTLLRQAVETSGHTDTSTLFIQKGVYRSDWVDEKLRCCTLMIYPKYPEIDDRLLDHRLASRSAGASTGREDIRALFWDNVSTMMGDLHLDATHRAMLNDFGRVQHPVFQSPDHNTVHVIYGHSNRYFVYGELTEELKTRTGLQLVPPQSRVATLSSTDNSVLIVVEGNHDLMTARWLREAVETSGHPDTQTLFIRKDHSYPYWVKQTRPRCTRMSNNTHETHNASYDLHRQPSVSTDATTGPKDERTLFWDDVSTMIGVKCHSVPHSSDQPSDEDKVVISVDGSTNLTEIANTQPAGSSQTPCVSLIHHKELDAASTEEVKGERHGMVLTTDAAEGESDKSDQNCSVEADFECCYCFNDSSSSSSSQSTSDCENAVIASSSDAGLQSTEYLQSSSVGSADQSALVHDSDRGLPCPIFSPTWQAASLFTREGGTLRKPGSDAILLVPPDAVKSDDGVLVHAAVCADVAWIRRLLKVSEDEQVVSPLAEFWAGRDFKFQRPVSVALPHWLPENADPDLVQVYHVTRSNNAHVDFTELNRRSQKTCTSGPKDATSFSELDMSEAGYFSLEEDQIIVFTDHFSGFVCTYCPKNKMTRYRPELYLAASGSISVPRDSLTARVDVCAHIWDKRIKVADFRQEHGIAPGRLEHVELLTRFKGSKLELNMRSDKQLTYRPDAGGKRLDAGDTKCFDLMADFGCSKCAVEGKQLPKSHKWAMKSLPGRCLLSEFEVAVNVLNFVEEGKNSEQATTTLLFTITPVLEQNSTTQPQPATSQTSVNHTRSSTTQTDTDECSADRFCDHTPLTGASSSSRQHVMSNGQASGATHYFVPANGSASSLAARIEEPLAHQNGVVGQPVEPPPSASTNAKMIPKPVMTQTEMPGEPNAEQWRHLLSALDTGQLERVAEGLNIERMHRRHDDGHRVAENHRQYIVDMCCRQDAANVRAALVALIHLLEQRLTTSQSAIGHSALLENGASHSQQPTDDSPDDTSGEDDSSCPPAQRRRVDRSGDTSTTAPVRDSLNALVGNSSNTLVSDSSNASEGDSFNALVGDSSTACVPRDSADFHQPHPSIPEEFGAKPCNHNSGTQMAICVTQTRTEMTVRGTDVGPLVPFASIMPSLPGQASPLALTEPVPDAVFKHVDKQVILRISKMLSPTGAMSFFLALGLTRDQYDLATTTRRLPEEAYNECFILLGRCKNAHINVEKLVQALEDIDRYDIVEEVREIQNRIGATVSTRE